MDITTLRDNLTDIEERIARATARAGRARDEITLVAVTKTHPVEVVARVYELGLRDVGENRIEEALPKAVALPTDLRWHMIGHIQSRKARQAVSPFHLIHSMDSLKLAQEFHKRASGGAGPVAVLLQVNVSGEESKYGFAATTPAEIERFTAEVAEILALPTLRVRGLMTMAPFVDDPEQARPVFAATRRLRERLRRDFPAHEWEFLSMGMTNDFEIAIEEGATHVRIGTALFGARPTP